MSVHAASYSLTTSERKKHFPNNDFFTCWAATQPDLPDDQPEHPPSRQEPDITPPRQPDKGLPEPGDPPNLTPPLTDPPPSEPALPDCR